MTDVEILSEAHGVTAYVLTIQPEEIQGDDLLMHVELQIHGIKTKNWVQNTDVIRVKICPALFVQLAMDLNRRVYSDRVADIHIHDVWTWAAHLGARVVLTGPFYTEPILSPGQP